MNEAAFAFLKDPKKVLTIKSYKNFQKKSEHVLILT